MADYVTLFGGEDVANAGRTISHAAGEMRRASSEISEAQLRIAQDLERFESAARLIGLAALVALRGAELAAHSANAAAVGERMNWAPDSYQECDETRELRRALGLPEPAASEEGA